MTLTINRENYINLLAEFLPKVIENEAEYEDLLAKVEQLIFNKNKTIEQQNLQKLLVLLIEKYETEHYPIEAANPHKILQHLMEPKGILQADLVGVIGSSGVISEIIKGKRSISKAQAKALGDYFKPTFRTSNTLQNVV